MFQVALTCPCKCSLGSSDHHEHKKVGLLQLQTIACLALRISTQRTLAESFRRMIAAVNHPLAATEHQEKTGRSGLTSISHLVTGGSGRSLAATLCRPCISPDKHTGHWLPAAPCLYLSPWPMDTHKDTGSFVSRHVVGHSVPAGGAMEAQVSNNRHHARLGHAGHSPSDPAVTANLVQSGSGQTRGNHNMSNRTPLILRFDLDLRLRSPFCSE